MRAFNTLTLLAVTVSAYIRDYSDDLWDSEGNKTCRAEAELTSPSWLHRWIGTYYNGTIEVTVHVDRGDHCAEWPALFNETYAGVLSLLDAKYAGPASDIRHTSGYTNPFAFLLDGWAPNTTQASLFANRSTESYLPPAVKLEMESIYWFRHFSLEVLPWDLQNEHLTPNCKVSNATISAASGYNFTCPYRGEPFSDDSQFSLPISACNATNTAPFIAGIRRGYYTYKMRSSSSLRGTFNEKSADFEWDLGFSGAFTTDPIRQWNSSTYLDIVGGVRPDWQTGIFTMKFKGNVDNEHSHQMVLGPGSNLSWVEDVDKTKDNTFCAAALNVTLDESLGISLHATTWMAAAIIVGWSLVWVNYL